MVPKNKTKIFGILNLTPDSFSDGAQENLDMDRALTKAISMYMHGTDVLDIGAESTRPGAQEITAEEEINRIIPFLLQFKKNISWPVSVDTRKPRVAEEVLSYGVEYINDVSGLQDEDMAKVIAKGSDTTQIVLMHSKGEIPPIPCIEVPEDFYGEQGLFEHMKEFFSKGIETAMKYGIAKERLIFDPGIGFGKSVTHNLELVQHLSKLKEKFQVPFLIGASRKSFLSAITTEADPLKLDAATAAFNAMAISGGADMVRVHDVKFHRDVLKVVDAITGVADNDPHLEIDLSKAEL